MAASDGAARLRLLYDLGCAFAERIEIDELIPLVAAKCREALDAEGVAILLLDPEREELYFPYAADEDPKVTARLLRLRFPAGRGIAGCSRRPRAVRFYWTKSARCPRPCKPSSCAFSRTGRWSRLATRGRGGWMCE
jgi:hypothetical protein